MDRATYTMGVNIQNAVYEGVWNQTPAPELKIPNPRGDSLSSSLVESSQHPRITLRFDEHLLMQSSGELTRRFNEAYDEEARREDEEFFKTTRAYYRRRFNAKD